MVKDDRGLQDTIFKYSYLMSNMLTWRDDVFLRANHTSNKIEYVLCTISKLSILFWNILKAFWRKLTEEQENSRRISINRAVPYCYWSKTCKILLDKLLKISLAWLMFDAMLEFLSQFASGCLCNFLNSVDNLILPISTWKMKLEIATSCQCFHWLCDQDDSYKSVSRQFVSIKHVFVHYLYLRYKMSNKY